METKTKVSYEKELMANRNKVIITKNNYDPDRNLTFYKNTRLYKEQKWICL